MKFSVLKIAAIGFVLVTTQYAAATPECPMPEMPNRYRLYEQTPADDKSIPHRFNFEDGEKKIGVITEGGIDSQKFFDYGDVMEFHGVGENAPFYGAARVAKHVGFGSRVDVVDCNGVELVKIREEYSHEENEPEVGYKFCDPEFCGGIFVAEKDGWFAGSVTLRDAISNRILATLKRPAQGWYPDHWSVTKESDDGVKPLDARVLALFGAYKISKDYERHQAAYSEWEHAGKAIGREKVLGDGAPIAPAEPQDLESMGLQHIASATPIASHAELSPLEEQPPDSLENTFTSSPSATYAGQSYLGSSPNSIVVHENGWSYWQNYFYWEMMRQHYLRDERRAYQTSGARPYQRPQYESQATQQPSLRAANLVPPSKPWKTRDAGPTTVRTPARSEANVTRPSTTSPRLSIAPMAPQNIKRTPTRNESSVAVTPAPAPAKRGMFDWLRSKPKTAPAVTPKAPSSASRFAETAPVRPQATRVRPAPAAPKGETRRELPVVVKPQPEVRRERPAPIAPKAEARRERPAPIAPKAEARRERPAPIAPKAEARRERPAPIAPKAEARRERPAPIAPKAEVRRERPAPIAPKVERPRVTAPKIERPRITAPKVERPRSSASPSRSSSSSSRSSGSTSSNSRSNSNRGSSSNRGSTGSGRSSGGSSRRR